MGSIIKNPFELFGLTPDLARRLGEKELFSVVKSLYRTLLKVYHPDKCHAKTAKVAVQDAKRTVDLNLAFEKLNLEKDAASFRRHVKSYSARSHPAMHKKVAALEKDVKEAQDMRAALEDRFMLYLLNGLVWRDDCSNGAGKTILSPADVKLGLNDVAITQNVKAVSWSLGSNYKEIVFDPLGSMYYRPVGRSNPFPVNYIQLLGVIETGRIDLLPLLDRVPPKEGFFRSPALDSRYGIDGASLQVLNTIPVERFKKHCLHLLEPRLLERAYLFSIHRPVFEQEARITIEGVIVKISKP